jgi:hypothetical protein
MSAPLLEACPLCRSTLRGGEQQCPSCGGDLTPYLAAAARSRELVALAQHWIHTGETARASSLLPRLSQLSSLAPSQIVELRAELALASGDLALAGSLATQSALAPESAQRLQAAVGAAQERRQTAHELYNAALAAARRGSPAEGAELLSRAVQLEPQEARLWLLKLKVDLKPRLLSRCYADLQALDGLAARPPEFARLEALLPATAGH